MGTFLGISAFYHDSAAALVRDGEILGAAQEERFTRIKHDCSFPNHAIRELLTHHDLRLRNVDGIVFYDKPLLKFERLIESFVGSTPRGLASFIKAMPVWASEKLFQKSVIIRKLSDLSGLEKAKLPDIFFTQHHHAHASSAFFPSPFKEASILCVDGVGEWATTSAWVGSGEKIDPIWKLDFPHSLGLLYSAFTAYCGFRVNSGEYKLMGLAPFGVPRYKDTIYKHLVDVKTDGSFRLNMEYFTFLHSSRMIGDKFRKLFGAPERGPEASLEKFHADIASSIQHVIEEILMKLVQGLIRESGKPHLCLAGGVALNCVANRKLAQLPEVEKLWIQPAAGDAGGALGAALAMDVQQFKSNRSHVNIHEDAMHGSLLGPSQNESDLEYQLQCEGAVFHKLETPQLLIKTVESLSSNQIVGWFQGAMEFGPRALGNRSILADPRSPKMQSWINRKIKFRESFRPFAPVVLESHVEDFFEMNTESSPYMLMTGLVKEFRGSNWDPGRGQGKLVPPVIDSALPAVTHVDGSARIQTVNSKVNPLLSKLLEAFETHTGVPVLVNTSFNIRGEPIVCSARDAFKCFLHTNMDVLVVGSFFMRKSDQVQLPETDNWKKQFPLD